MIFLFPGQGSQKSGMGLDFYEASPPAREVFDQAKALYGDSFLEAIFSGDQEELNHTTLAQPALLTVETAIQQHLLRQGYAPSGCAGHSLGEIPALVCAGALSFEDAFAFTQERARLMSEEVPDGGMAAVLGLAPEAIGAALPEGVSIANYNGPAQTIITGASTGLKMAAENLKAAGAKRVLPIKVSGPFHSPFMKAAQLALARLLEAIDIRPPHVPFISSVSAQVESSPESIRELLAAQLTRPVRWTEVMAAIPTDARIIEVGPGSVLKGLAKRMEGAPVVVCVDTIAAAEAL